MRRRRRSARRASRRHADSPNPSRVVGAGMKATIINCTLKPSPEESNTEALLKVLIEALESHDVECELIRAVDLDLKPGVETDMGEGDDWPQVHEKLLDSEILVIGTPTWLGRPSSVASRVLERMDAMLSETDDEERPGRLQPRRGRGRDRQRGRRPPLHLRDLAVSSATSATRSPARRSPTGTRARARATSTSRRTRATTGRTRRPEPPLRTSPASPERSRRTRWTPRPSSQSLVASTRWGIERKGRMMHFATPYSLRARERF